MVRISQVTLRIDQPALVSVMANINNQAAMRLAQKVRSRAINNMNAKGRRDTGRMARLTQVRKEVSPDPLSVQYSVGTTAVDPRTGFPYPIVQEKGSRGHGPRTAPFLVFTPKGGSHPISVRYVRGVTPGNFFRDALAATRASDALP